MTIKTEAASKNPKAPKTPRKPRQPRKPKAIAAIAAIAATAAAKAETRPSGYLAVADVTCDPQTAGTINDWIAGIDAGMIGDLGVLLHRYHGTPAASAGAAEDVAGIWRRALAGEAAGRLVASAGGDRRWINSGLICRQA